jgi:hypothetical protein
MSELLIYIPAASASEGENALRAAGLKGLLPSLDFPSPAPIMRDVATGPAEAPGVIVGYPDQHERHGLAVGYFAKEQSWTESKSGGRPVWFGRRNGRKCNPAALRRYTEFPSDGVRFDDGQVWQIPAMQLMPRDLHFVDGRLTEVVREAYRPYVDAGAKLYAAMVTAKRGDPESGVTATEVWNFVISGLALNYCLTPEIVEHLGLIRSRKTLITAAGASVSYPSMLDFNRRAPSDAASASVA